MTLCTMFAVTLMIAGASQPSIHFVKAPDAEYASEFALVDTYAEVLSVEEVPLPDDVDDFANQYFDLEPGLVTAYPISDIFPDEHDDENRYKRFHYDNRIVEVIETYPSGEVLIIDLETDETFVTNLLNLEELC